jgi:hypothetical protein
MLLSSDTEARLCCDTAIGASAQEVDVVADGDDSGWFKRSEESWCSYPFSAVDATMGADNAILAGAAGQSGSKTTKKTNDRQRERGVFIFHSFAATRT